MSGEALSIALADGARVSGLWLMPADARAAFVFAHGAGAGMTHATMEAWAQALAERGIATLRFQFPYMERGSRRPDAPAIAHAAVRAAVSEAARLAPELPLYAGGRSFGGRMSSQAQALEALPGVGGLVFLGFPLHPAKKPSIARADHLAEVALPMLFTQGTRDELADLDLLQNVIRSLGPRATLHLIDGADHSFRVRGRKEADVRAELLDAIAAWISDRPT